MAADWIKMRKDLPDDPAVIAVAAALSIDPDLVVVKLYRLWSWADTHTANGKVPGITGAHVDALVRAEGFSKNLANAGWLNIDENGISFPKFNRHMSKSAKRRAVKARAAANRRGRQKGDARRPAKATKCLPREEKRREDKDTPNGVSPPLPPSLDSDAFRIVWGDWLAYRKERKLKTTEQTRKAQLVTLAGWGPELAAEALQTSIRQGWQGFFDPREKRSNGAAAKPQVRELVDIDAMELPE